MDFAIMHINKYKNRGGMIKSFNHNYRKVLSANIDPARIKDNKEYVEDYTGKQNYYEAFRKRIATLPYYVDHQIRKNAVYGFEVVLTMSPEMTGKVDIDKWGQANVKWLEETFGKENVESAILHVDEGTDHIHAFIIPVADGKLNAKHFINGPSSLREMQTSYAEAMEPFGLSRGVVASKATHQTVKYMQGVINRELEKELPPVEKNHLGVPESAEKYKEKIEPMVKDLVLQNTMMNIERRNYHEVTKTLVKKDKYINQKAIETEGQITDLTKLIKEMNEKAEKWELLQKGLNSHPNKEVRENISAAVNNMIAWETAREVKEQNEESR